jgi:hypothetical protein
LKILFIKSIANDFSRFNLWLKQIPLKSMIDWGWVDKFQNKGDQVRACLKFYGVASIQSFEKQTP